VRARQENKKKKNGDSHNPARGKSLEYRPGYNLKIPSGKFSVGDSKTNEGRKRDQGSALFLRTPGKNQEERGTAKEGTEVSRS